MAKLAVAFALAALVYSLSPVSAARSLQQAAPPPTVVTPIANAPAPACTQTPLQALQSQADFSVLVLALNATGLAPTFNSSTVSGSLFAPTNAAFQSFATDNNIVDLPTFVAENMDLVRSVLLYHYVPTVTEIPPDTPVTTAQGSTLTLQPDSTGVEVLTSSGGAAEGAAGTPICNLVVYFLPNDVLMFGSGAAAPAPAPVPSA